MNLHFKKLPMFILVFIFNITAIFAQKIITDCKEIIYKCPENISQEQAKYEAFKKLKEELIEDKFGSSVRGVKEIIQEEVDGKYRDSYYGNTSSIAKGEWIKTTQEPKYTTISKDNQIFLKVKACGTIREIVGNKTNISIKVMNHVDSKSEILKFKNGEQMFLSFSSPTNGYIAVYLVDKKTAQCLLPYPNDKLAEVKVEGGKDYVFFSEKTANRNEKNIVEEYFLETSKTLLSVRYESSR